MATVPRTIARLQPYIKIYNTSATQTLIGAVQQINLDISRPTDQWRELNTEFEGRPVEIYPKLPEYKATLRRIVLYESAKSTMLKSFNFSDGFDIVDQTAPLQISIELSAPDAANVKTIKLTDVWFENANLTFNIEDNDLRIVQDVPARFRAITVS